MSKIFIALFSKLLTVSLIVISSSLPVQSQIYTPELDSAYHLLAAKKTKEATALFENHIKLHPEDTKVYLQLAYIYDSQDQPEKSLKYFQYVKAHSVNKDEVDQATASIVVMKDKVIANAKRSISFDIQNYYDSYQKNYIAGLTAYYNYKVTKEFYTGGYLDVFTDSRSKPEEIFNDRYVEIGWFIRFLIIKGLYFESRIGFVRELDVDSGKSSINLSPRLIYGTRIGNSQNYIGNNPKSKGSIFMDIYSSLSYDYKFRNGFFQLGLQEVWRNNIVGYSYIDFYLLQYLTVDTRKLDYNNYVESGPGIGYKPNLPYFPLIFVETTYKYYLPIWGNHKTSSTQVKAGLRFSFRLKV